jgi:hypothetical protein
MARIEELKTVDRNLKWYKAITKMSDDSGCEDSFIVLGSGLFNAYRNSISIMAKVVAKTESNRRVIVKVIPAPHLDEYAKSKNY